MVASYAFDIVDSTAFESLEFPVRGWRYLMLVQWLLHCTIRVRCDQIVKHCAYAYTWVDES